MPWSGCHRPLDDLELGCEPLLPVLSIGDLFKASEEVDVEIVPRNLIPGYVRYCVKSVCRLSSGVTMR
jgi:hypothetical protein